MYIQFEDLLLLLKQNRIILLNIQNQSDLFIIIY